LVIFGKEDNKYYYIIIMWNEMCDNLHISRSVHERLRYENDEDLKYDEYTERIIDDQEIYDNELKLDKYGKITYDIDA
jgi:hypothetical protein